MKSECLLKSYIVYKIISEHFRISGKSKVFKTKLAMMTNLTSLESIAMTSGLLFVSKWRYSGIVCNLSDA